jgi:hypothetical protein
MPYDPSQGLSPEEMALLLRKMQQPLEMTGGMGMDDPGRSFSLEQPPMDPGVGQGAGESGILDELEANPYGYGSEGLASPEEGINPPQDPEPLHFGMPEMSDRSPGMAAFDLIGERFPQEATSDNARDIASTAIMGPVLSKVLSGPKMAGGFIASQTGAFSPSEAGEGAEEVKKLQAKLRDAGYYTGPIDGLMKGKTQEAKKAFEADEMQRLKQETERQAAQAASNKAEADRAETLRKAQEAIAKADARKAGDARLKQAEEDVPLWRRGLRDYGGIAALLSGIVLGGATKKGVNKLSDKFSEKAASRANDIINAPARDTAGKVAKVNQFWAQGQKGAFSGKPEAPFVASPRSKTKFKANPDAPEASSLYQPSKLRDMGTDAGVAATFGVESGIGQFVVEPEAREELRHAEEAVNQDPSEVNIERLQTAKDRVAMAESLKNLGRGAAGGYLAGGIKYRRQHARPDVAKAEGEKIRLEQSMGQKPKPKPKAKKLKFIPGKPQDARSGMGAKEATEKLGLSAEAWFKSNPNKHLNGTHVKEMSTNLGLDISDRQAANVARRLRTSYGERYINQGAKAALAKD